MRNIKLFILFSGNGSNLENLYQTLEAKEVLKENGEYVKIEFVGALSNNPDAYGITRCHHLGIPVMALSHKDYRSREEYDEALLKALFLYEPDFVVLCGFMRILTPLFLEVYKCINIHPSFLPYHKGAQGIKDSFEDGEVDFGGVSIHYVNEELDAGEIIMQEKLSKVPFKDFSSFQQAIHELEYKLYPQAILKVVREKV